MFWWICEITYIPSTIFLKLSIGVFLQRIVVAKTHLRVIRFVMICSGVFGFAYFLIAIFQCHPIQAFWIQKHALTSANYGRCLSNDAVVGLTFASSALNSVADFTFAILPLFIVKDLRMTKRSKRLIGGILAFANIACIATIIRMPSIPGLARGDDFLYETTGVALWSDVEVGIGIAAACLATMRPLLRKIFGRRSSMWLPDRQAVVPEHKTWSLDVPQAPSSGINSYVLQSSAPPLRPDCSQLRTEISAGQDSWRDRLRQEKQATSVRQEMAEALRPCSSFEEQRPIPSSPSHKGNVTPMFEIRKNVEFTWTVEDNGHDQLPGRISAVRESWILNSRTDSDGRISPLDEGSIVDGSSVLGAIPYSSKPR